MTHPPNPLPMFPAGVAVDLGGWVSPIWSVEATGNVAPTVNDPPGVLSVSFDLTLTDAIPPASGFASLGITIFGALQPDYPGGQQFGLQAQFADFVPLEALAPGTYPITLELSSATHPLAFAAGQSFNDIMGGFGTGANDVIPTGFQFFLNKTSALPVTF